MPKVFEIIIFNQINEYIEPFLSNLLTGFRENHNTQHRLLKMLEKWKEALDKSNFVDAIFMDLSKAFDTLNHDLLIVKLEAYGLSLNSFRYTCSYLRQSLQRTGANNSFSLRKDIIAGVPQRSLLDPLLFNIYISDIFLFLDTAFLGNYADDTTLYSIQNNPKSNQAILNYNFTTLQKWVYENYMVLNPSKCFYMCLGSNSEINNFILEDRTKIPLTLEHEVLGITIDTNLNLYSHLQQLCKKVPNKLNALTRIIPVLGKKQINLLYNSFFKGQLSYCPLIWTFCSRHSNNLINKLQERVLRVVYNDYDSSYNELLEKANENTIHIKNIHILMTEIYKLLNGLSPPIMSKIFKKRIAHNY